VVVAEVVSVIEDEATAVEAVVVADVVHEEVATSLMRRNGNQSRNSVDW